MVQLDKTGIVEETVEFGSDTRLEYLLEVGGSEGLQASDSLDRIRVTVPSAMAEKWQQPDEVALSGEQAIAGGGILDILLEKDFACLTPSGREDDADAFPNPDAANG